MPGQPVALVTGGANGIGRAIATHLLRAGWRAGIVDLQKDALGETYPRRGKDTLLIEGDVGDEDLSEHAVRSVVDAFGRLDALVSNAGIMVRKPLNQLALAEW